MGLGGDWEKTPWGVTADAAPVKRNQAGGPTWKDYEADESSVARATRKMAPVGWAESIST